MDETDAVVRRILTTYDTIAVVGASHSPDKPSHYVPAQMQRHGWRIIPINPHAEQILGEKVYRSLTDVPEPIGLVDIFRPSAETAGVVREAIKLGATAVWLQLGIVSREARAVAEEAGILYVENRCLAIEQRHFGVNAPIS